MIASADDDWNARASWAAQPMLGRIMSIRSQNFASNERIRLRVAINPPSAVSSGRDEMPG